MFKILFIRKHLTVIICQRAFCHFANDSESTLLVSFKIGKHRCQYLPESASVFLAKIK